ncbi:hypothetical protein GCM10010873_27930 [Cypionkella aquatica]|uniref:Uncharacterized protein n=1 Tax=Cypionkella aquatica TaxID=1756042 RepID=A0AA37U559_9RHOB|nr:hypothetical protein [Cypionkella aquatica]GLS87819.1 hypothetical protein GCM10010873_27930 [Cypionkella aquatica]
MLTLWRARPYLFGCFVLACAVTLFFAGRFAYSVVYWANPAHQNQAVEPWMTAGYIAKSWSVPGPKLDLLAGLPGPAVKGHPQPMAEIARDRGVPVAEVIARVEKAIKVLQLLEPAK